MELTAKEKKAAYAKGGDNSVSNIQPLCQTCNLTKYTKHIDYRLPMAA